MIIHELPDRLRIKLFIPRGHSFDVEKIKGVKGVKYVSFNQRTGSLRVTHNGDGSTKKAMIGVIENASLSFTRGKSGFSKGNPDPLAGDNLRRKKRAVIRSGGLLIASPLMPLPLKLLVAFYGAMPIFKKGIKSLSERRINIDALDSSAIAVSLGIRDFRTAGIITFLLKSGDYLEEWTKDRSRKMLSNAFQVCDEEVWVRSEGMEYMVKTSELKEGDTVVVRTGSCIPVDGIVIEGEAMVNQSSMTGESLPVMKAAGVTVYAGTVVEEGTLFVKAMSVSNDTRVAKITSVIEEAAHLKADIQSHAERLADRLVPYTFLLSSLTYALTGNPVRAASVLLVDYSCAIKLSTPLAIMSGMIRSAREGALIKGGRFVEKLSKAEVFVIDKTGTLTEASPVVMDVAAFNGYDKDYVLKYAACVEEHFPHPVATAIVKKAKDDRLIHEEEHGHVEYVVAHGIASNVNGKRILVGSRHFVSDDNGIDTGIADGVIKNFADKGHSILYVAVEKELAGIIAIDDPVRKESLEFLRMLKESGITKIIMLTGDTDTAARNVAGRLGIQEYYSQIFPEQKTEIIKLLKNDGHVVAMVGDGINDSPALSHADVGISMKHGADIAKEACDVLLLDGSLLAIVDARRISRQAMNTIRQNFRYNVGINSALIGLGLSGALSPAISAFMHNATTVISALNSLRILKSKDVSGIGRRYKPGRAGRGFPTG